MDDDRGERDSAEFTLARPGDRIGHYEILAEIGRGAMGIVFRARDLNLSREVALKRPWPDLVSDEKCRRRFLREARAASGISHPNVVQVFEAFEAEGCPWIALQCVDGPDLEAILVQEKRLPVDRVLRYGEDLAAALKAAHERNVLHRDIKPRNILISADDRALLSDFGLARILQSDSLDQAATASITISSVGTVVGTPRYMSPEQVLGRPLDARSDIFCLGSVMYEMCTGVPAFPATSHAVIYDAIIHREPKPIAQFTYEIPEELERIIRKAMAKRPDERYQNTGDLLVDLRTLRRRTELSEYSQESQAQPFRISSTVRRRFLRHALWIGPVVVTSALTFMLVTRNRHAAVPLAEPIQVTSAAAWERDPVISPDGGRIAYASEEGGNSDIYVVDIHGGTPLRIVDDPAGDFHPTWFPDGSAIAFTSDRSGYPCIWKTGQLGGGATLLVDKAWEPAVSPDGTRIAFVVPSPSRYSRIGVASLSDPTRITILTDDSGGLWDHEHPAWSPDGRTICYTARHGLWTVCSDGGRARVVTPEGELERDPTWSPSGHHIYFASARQGTIALWRILVSSGEAERVTLGTSEEGQPSISEDATRLAYATRLTNRNLVIHDLATGQRTSLQALPDAVQAAFSPDMRLLCFVSQGINKELALWLQPLEDGNPTGTPYQLTNHPGNASHPTFSPDGHWIAYQRILKDQRDIWIMPTRGGQSVSFADEPAADMTPAWSPDGSLIAFASERADSVSHIWLAPVSAGRPAGPARRIEDGPGRSFAPQWSVDGSHIAFVCAGKELNELWVSPVDGSAPARQVTAGYITRAKWSCVDEDLWVSAVWENHRYSLRRVSARDGTVSQPEPPVDLGPESSPPTFDLSTDGRWIVFPFEETKGDIWLLEAKEGRY